MPSNQVSVYKNTAPSGLLPQIDPRDADADFLHAISENAEDIYSIAHGDEVVGLALAEPGESAWLYVYIFPPHRGRGYGKQAVALSEALLSTPQAKEIATCCRSRDAAACGFAAGCGYAPKFASDYMRYSGPPMAVETLPVRKYRDEDFSEAFSLYAEAFHAMRLSTGCFPDSAVAQPSEETRKHWADTAGERLVYLSGGEVVGCAHIEGDTIGSVSVKLTHQGRGIGKGFVKHVINHILSDGHKTVSLYCVAGNEQARRLYDSLGFAEIYRNAYAVKKL